MKYFTGGLKPFNGAKRLFNYLSKFFSLIRLRRNVVLLVLKSQVVTPVARKPLDFNLL